MNLTEVEKTNLVYIQSINWFIKILILLYVVKNQKLIFILCS